MDKIEIKGYKSIKNLSLEMRPINIFIGSNGSGKSNFLSFFEMLKFIFIQGFREYVALRGGIDKFLFEGRKITDEISAHLYFRDNGYSFTLKAGEDGFIFTKEGLWYGNWTPYGSLIDIASLNSESSLPSATPDRAMYVRRYLEQLEKYHFHDTSINSPLTKVSNVQKDIYRLYNDGSNLAAFLYGIKQNSPQAYQLIVGTIQSIAPYFRDFYFQPDQNGNLILLWNDKFSSSIYGVNDMSDGTKRFVALSTLFLQPTLPQTIIIDEPELGLHPAAIGKLASMIHVATRRNCQVIIATQSAELINYFETEDVITVHQQDGESIFTRLSNDELSEWLDKYSLGELWQKNVIGGRP